MTDAVSLPRGRRALVWADNRALSTPVWLQPAPGPPGAQHLSQQKTLVGGIGTRCAACAAGTPAGQPGGISADGKSYKTGTKLTSYEGSRGDPRLGGAERSGPGALAAQAHGDTH